MKVKDRVKEFKRVKGSELVPNPKNWRKHPDQQVSAMKGLLAEIGFAGAALAYETKHGLKLIDGHLRAELSSDQELPVLVLDVNDEEADKILLTFDAITQVATPDLAQFDNLVSELEFESPDINELLASLSHDMGVVGPDGSIDPGETPSESPVSPPKEPVAQLGDLWILGQHRLLCGDCTDAGAVTLLMDGQKALLINTDPPYGVDYSKVKDGIPRKGFENHQEQWGDIKNDDLEGEKLQDFLVGVFGNLKPHFKEGIAWYIWHSHSTCVQFWNAASQFDVVLHRQVLWKKPGFVLTRSGMYHLSHEPCFYGWIKGNQPPWYGEKNQTTVWEVGRDDDSGQHPTQKPVELFTIPISNHLQPGEICVEPFSGSGSQIIAAELCKVRCFAMELEPKYIDVAIQRWQNISGEVATLEGKGFREVAKDRGVELSE